MKDEIAEIGYIRIGNPVKCKVSNDAGIYYITSIDGINGRVMLDGARQGQWYSLDKIRGIPINEDILKKMPLMEKNPGGSYGVFIETGAIKNFSAAGVGVADGMTFSSTPEDGYSIVRASTNPPLKFKYWHDFINFVACIDAHIDLIEESEPEL